MRSASVTSHVLIVGLALALVSTAVAADWPQWRGPGRDGKVTPFEGMTLHGRVQRTIVRGRVVYDVRDGIADAAGHGKLLRANDQGA